MAVQFDHLYLPCGDSNNGAPDVTKELKDFNVLHLDLIQQQAEQLAAKDKIIKALQEENSNLRARLDRIERRLSLGVQKKNTEVSPISVQTEFSSDASCLLTIKSEFSPKSLDVKSTSRNQLLLSPSASSPKSPTHLDNESFSQGRAIRKDCIRKVHSKASYNHSTPPCSPPLLRISPREKKIRKDAMQEEENTIQNNNNTISSANSKSVSCETKESKDLITPCQKRTCDESLLPFKKSRLPSVDQGKTPESKEDDLTDHNLRSRHKTQECTSKNVQSSESFVRESSPISIPSKSSEVESTLEQAALESTRSKGKPKVDSWKVRSDGILTSDASYFLINPRHFGEFSSLEENNGSETQVELPRWRIKVLTSLYVMEGTENLEDEIFLKRHTKLEQDEKRRKRWDLQRLREQRQYEKLRERYERSNQQDSNSGCLSLWPTPESTHFLEINENLPVCAFGQPLAQIPQSEFVVPWAPDIAGITTRRRKR